MKTNTLTQSRKDMIMNFLLAFTAIVLLTGLASYVFPVAFAADTTGTAQAKEIIGVIVKILRLITIIVGSIFVLVGIVKFAMAHANEDGPGQQKAIMMMATGVVLILLGTVILGTLGDTVAGWIAEGLK